MVDFLAVGVRLAGIALLAALAAAVVGFGYRVFTHERIGYGVPTLVGLSAAAVYLNVRTALGEVVIGATAVLAVEAVAFNSAALLLAAAATPTGRVVGDRVATDLVSVGGARELDADVGRLARSLARVATVTLPNEVGDIEGYDPVPEATKTALAGTTLVFPRSPPVGERRERLATRLKEEYDVGYVDAEFDGEKLVSLAVGARMAGLGPTLAPGATAVAVSADPPNAASPGDVVQAYTRGPDPERVATAEVRAVAGDTVTLACDAPEATRLAGGEYRLVTLPAEPRPEREFASLLRAADETMGVVDVTADGPLAGATVGSVDATVVAVRDADGAVVPIPPRARALDAGETLYVVARPETIRGLEG